MQVDRDDVGLVAWRKMLLTDAHFRQCAMRRRRAVQARLMESFVDVSDIGKADFKSKPIFCVRNQLVLENPTVTVHYQL